MVPRIPAMVVLYSSLAMHAYASTAVAPPEVLTVFPAEYTGHNNSLWFSAGRTRSGQGSIVAGAYFSIRSESQQSNIVWVTDGTPSGTHPAASHGEQGNRAVSPDVGLFFTAHDDNGALQLFSTDGREVSERQLTHTAIRESWLRGVLDGDPLITRSIGSTNTAVIRINAASGEESEIQVITGTSGEWFTVNQRVLGVSQSGVVGDHITAFLGGGQSPVDVPVPAPNTAWDYPHRIASNSRVACAKAYTHHGPTVIIPELYCTDGTPAGTHRPSPAGGQLGLALRDDVTFYGLGSRMLIANTRVTPQEMPWVTDGTDVGTYPLLESSPDFWSTCTDGESGSTVLAISRNTETMLWYTDGSRIGTRPLISIPAQAACPGLLGTSVPGSGLAYFFVDSTLYASDGSPDGTHAVDGAPAVFSNGDPYYPLQGIVVLGRWLVFAGKVSATEDGLWRIDLDPLFSSGMDE
ncbi:hypothetical protein SAMN05216289_11552 [Dokdonella immobilis]|uniref:ELWxxDGT repeat-containing protein n=2 Tax=Dokdonella immobilis TaxID=578942 RepID=A0A1I4Y6V7_9GAMM|nr:hypothetical protein SAMN05216289_11552 [Dokdonella immobilis]